MFRDVDSTGMFYNERNLRRVSAAKNVLYHNFCDTHIQNTIKSYYMFQLLRHTRQEHSLRQRDI